MARRARESFITSVNIRPQVPLSEIDPLSDVRMEHSKLQGVVSALGVKVDHMIDLQRKEFIEAYDGHMQSIQRELLTLRNKVISIDQNFREEKLKRIQAEEELYRNECLRLDNVIIVKGEKLFKLGKEMKTVHSEVKWLMSKLSRERAISSSFLKTLPYEAQGDKDDEYKERRRNEEDFSSSSLASGSSSQIQYVLNESLASFSSCLPLLPPKKKFTIKKDVVGYSFPVNEWPHPLARERKKQLSSPSKPSSSSSSLLPLSDAKRALHDLVIKRSIQSEVLTYLQHCESHARKDKSLLNQPENPQRPPIQ